MELKMIQVSSLEKVRANDTLAFDEIYKKTALPGERFSYQICIKSDQLLYASLSVESPLRDHIRLYLEKDAYMDLPAKERDMTGEDYLTLEPGLMPDILVPMEEQNGNLKLSDRISRIWVKTDIPRDAKPGIYEIKINITKEQNQLSTPEETSMSFVMSRSMSITIIPAVISDQKLLYTRWLYADCIAVQHNVGIYSEEHWRLIDKYIAAAADMGINMMLVPIHTPPLDTEIGTTRPCVQLVDIEKRGEHYTFSFGKFKRFIDICKRNGIKYFEMAHLFSQWGAKYAPNIMVTENGTASYRFGWHVSSDSEEYISFLKQYIKAISVELKKEGISENTYFHISDEPGQSNLDAYKKASEIIRPLIGKSKTFDALSDYTFYEKGLVECPVTSVVHIHEFLKHDIENQWTYYCCDPEKIFTNCFMAMPSYRTRILGFLLYKYNIKGFLHWGFNFYNSALSQYPINPYLTTSGDKVFPSGDPFIVYPARDGVYPSIRGEVLYEAIQDMDICFNLETLTGRETVVQMIDRAAGRDLRFDDYPKNKEFPENLRSEMIDRINGAVL